MKVNVLIQLWLHFSIFRETYDLHTGSIQSIFAFYEDLKGFYKNRNRHAINKAYIEAMRLYSTLAMQLVRILLLHYRDYEVEHTDSASYTQDELNQHAVYNIIHIGPDSLNLNSWPEIAGYLFREYFIEPDFCCSSALYQRMKRAYQVLQESDCIYTHVKSNHLIYILFSLVEMANQTSTVCTLESFEIDCPCIQHAFNHAEGNPSSARRNIQEDSVHHTSTGNAGGTSERNQAINRGTNGVFAVLQYSFDDAQSLPNSRMFHIQI